MLIRSTRFLTLLLFAGVLCFASSCDDDDDPMIENEEEVITNVSLVLTPTSGPGTAVVSFTFADPDGDGPIAGTTAVSGSLAANTVYDAALTFTNASDPTDIEDITAEIRDEDEEHQVFYIVDNDLNLSFVYADQDGDGNPIGLLTEATTGDDSSGDIRLVLRHEPVKGPGITIASIDGAGGSTDVDIEFENVEIE